MNRELNLETPKTHSNTPDAKSSRPGMTAGNELSDDQIARISGGGGFPTNGGSGDTSINPTPTDPNPNPAPPPLP